MQKRENKKAIKLEGNYIKITDDNTYIMKLEGNILQVINEADKRVFVNFKTGDIAIGYKYGHGVRYIKYKDLVKLAWSLDFGNEINTLKYVDLPKDYPNEI